MVLGGHALVVVPSEPSPVRLVAFLESKTGGRASENALAIRIIAVIYSLSTSSFFVSDALRYILSPTGCFTDSGVVDLNERAENVMNKLGVPIVPAYDITHGQSWATPMEDGRCAWIVDRGRYGLDGYSCTLVKDFMEKWYISSVCGSRM